MSLHERHNQQRSKNYVLLTLLMLLIGGLYVLSMSKFMS